MHNFQKLEVWNVSMELTTEIYSITSNYPTDEKFGLISQMRRSSVSISSNIAEGSGRRTDKEFAHFLSIANGSSYELQTQLIVSKNVGYLDRETVEEFMIKINCIQKMLYSLITKFT